MAKAVIFNIFCLAIIFIGSAQCQWMNVSTNAKGICKGGQYRTLTDLKENLRGCVVIVGHLELVFRYKATNFTGSQLYDLREITEYLVIYQASGLESLAQLFPALTRIRGNRLVDNYALIVFDNPNLREIALYSLLKIDRGGIIIWASPQACYLDTIDWTVLAPKARHVISPSKGKVECNVPCNCIPYNSKPRCWDNKKCQLFIEEENCHDQCLGCRKAAKAVCFTCQNYNYQFNCVTECPSGTIVLPENMYCITKKECYGLDRFIFNNTCVAVCPIDYKLNNNLPEPTCEQCTHCEMNCSSLVIYSLGTMQNAEKCVYINGSLTLRIRHVNDAIDELQKYLNRIQEVSDYILIEASHYLTSLDFLSSLRVIRGNKLKNGKYSLYVINNNNLQTLFTPEVTKRLLIEKGTVGFEQNPVLCMKVINQMKYLFPTPPHDLDIPIGSNGYSGECNEAPFNFTLIYTSKTAIQIKIPIQDYVTSYTALYARLTRNVHTKAVPETSCSFEWLSTDVPTVAGKNFSIVELKDLIPASTYAFCVEIFNPDKMQLSRSNIVNFTTEVGTPEPPFIIELVAFTPNAVVLHWTDHENYIELIQNYELDVELLEMYPKDSTIDYCQFKDEFFEEDEIRHAVVRKPPPAYKRDCESICGILSSAPRGALVEEYFDVCDGRFNCGSSEENIIENKTIYQNYIQTLSLTLNAPKYDYQVGGLAPFSDYIFRLRACVNHQCSRSARGIVRTYRAQNADIISNVFARVDDLGVVTVTWEAPKISNGPILSYSVEVMPTVKISNIIPHVMCVRANETMTVIKSVRTSKYLVRVCLRTLASSRSCSEWAAIEVPPSSSTSKMFLLWTGVLFGILMYIATFLLGFFRCQRKVNIETIPLIDSMSSCRMESEPPAVFMLLDTTSMD